MGLFDFFFGSSSEEDKEYSKSSTSRTDYGGVRGVKITYNDSDKGTGRHETTFSNTTPEGKHEEGWHGKDYK